MVEEGSRFADLNRRAEADRALRPARFGDFVGQSRACRNLQVALEAARKRNEPIEHLLLSGLPGLGKTTLAHIVAAQLGADLKITSGPAMERTGDLVGLLTSLQPGDVLFIDEIHRLPRVVEEYLYPAMEDLAIDIVIDQGPAARSVRLTIEPFTLIGATTREGLLTAPFRARFGLLEKLELYPDDDLVRIVSRTAALLDVHIEEDALTLVASRARGTPRVANRLLRRVRDLAEVEDSPRVSVELAQEALAHLGIDAAGLEETDRKILRCLDLHAPAPVGIKTIAAAVGESEDTLETVYEPYLLTLGFIAKTPRGRQITDRGLAHIGSRPRGTDTEQARLFE